MRSLLLLAGAAILVGSGPALAKPGKGPAHSASRAALDVNRDGIRDYRQRTLADANGNGIADYRERRPVDINHNGIADYRERFIDRDRDGIDDREELAINRWGGAVCPPGLAKKTPACIPPGQASRSFRVGQRVPTGYRYYTDYDDLPSDYYTRYRLDDDYRYIYRNDYLYEVDPLTLLVRRVIGF